jgi:predicted dehydrogenase
MNNEKMRVVIIGCGRFSKFFVPLFKAHPVVEKVYVCDLKKERQQEYMEKFDVEGYESYEKALEDKSINAIAIFTQRFSHGRLVINALKAGKHVYSAVPCAVSIDEIKEIAKLVEETRLTYSMGETGAYRAPALFCRREFAKGTFGKFVYAEAHYNHDMSIMEDSFKSSGGDDWRKFAGVPPFFYPTHSTAMILSSMPGVYVTKVAAMGYEGSPRTDIFGREGQNHYDNPFANEAMLVKLSNGGIARISENRCVGWRAPETYISQFYGTNGGYEFSVANHHLSTWDPDRPGLVKMRRVTDELQPVEVSKMIREDYDSAIQNISEGFGFYSSSPIQPLDRLPEEYKGLCNGHNGTHHFLIDDFCRAFDTGKLSPTNIWAVARYNIPGLVAHESALAGGVLMDVPDLGNPPEDWEVLDYTK